MTLRYKTYFVSSILLTFNIKYMKRTFLWSLLGLIVAVCSLSACGNSDDSKDDEKGVNSSYLYGTWEAIHAEGYYTEDGKKVTYNEDVNGLDSEYMEHLQLNTDGTFSYLYPDNGEWTDDGDYGIFSLNGTDVSLRYHDDDEVEHRTIIKLTSDRLVLSWDNTEGTKHAVYTYKKLK